MEKILHFTQYTACITLLTNKSLGDFMDETFVKLPDNSEFSL